MVRDESKRRIFNSIDDFEQEFFPKSTKEKLLMNSVDHRNLGVIFAKKSLEKIKMNELNNI